VKIDEKTNFIVTGGASGLGEAVVRRVIELGGRATVLDMSDEHGKKIEEDFKGKVVFVKTNVTKEADVQKAIEIAVQKFGTISGVINCAGVGLPTRVISGRGQVHPLDNFNMVVQINLIGTFNVLRLAAAHMAKQPAGEGGERGVIINVASVAAFEGQIGQAAYSASKGGVVAMTLPIARELGALGIRVNTIAPGLFRTPMLMALPDKAKKSLYSQVPFPPRFGEPDEFASLCTHIIENQYFNGTVLRLDGSIRMSAM